MKSPKPWQGSSGRALLVIGACIVVAVLTGVGLTVLVFDTTRAAGVRGLRLADISQIAGFIGLIAALGLARKAGFSWPRWRPADLGMFWCVLRAGALGGVLCVLLSEVVSLMHGAPRTSAGSASPSSPGFEYPWLAVVSDAALVLGTPVVEEILFRGMLLETLLRSTARKMSVAISTLVFALPHMTPSGIAAGISIGLTTGYYYVSYRSLAPCVAVHVAWNLISLMEPELTRRYPELMHEHMTVIVGFTLSALLAGIAEARWAPKAGELRYTEPQDAVTTIQREVSERDSQEHPRE